ncbi:MAG TPA: hypothetical protein VK923_09150 [Euzebyales bacterium]|nr:hypothetical protein [Euzebyales bacterium]
MRTSPPSSTSAWPAGDPPDVAILPQPGLLDWYATSGDILPIDDLVGDEVRSGWAPVWQRLGSRGDELYGVWFKAANKSLLSVPDAAYVPCIADLPAGWSFTRLDVSDEGTTIDLESAAPTVALR